MSKKGCLPDNSACEGFFGRLKNEMSYQRDWTITTINWMVHCKMNLATSRQQKKSALYFLMLVDDTSIFFI